MSDNERIMRGLFIGPNALTRPTCDRCGEVLPCTGCEDERRHYAQRDHFADVGPMLLDTCKVLLDECVALIDLGGWGDPSPGSGHYPKLEAARAVIAKAEQKSS